MVLEENFENTKKSINFKKSQISNWWSLQKLKEKERERDKVQAISTRATKQNLEELLVL